MNHDTPARLIRTKDLNANREALRTLLEEIPGDVIKSALDIRYGLGGWAQEVFKRFPSCRPYLGYEQDAKTAEAAWKHPTNRIILRIRKFHPAEVSYRYRPKQFFRFDLVLADFNTTTMLKRDMVDEILPMARRYLIFTDVACVKLHLNFRAYGLDRPDLGEYWARFKLSGFRFVSFARSHHAASSALYERI